MKIVEISIEQLRPHPENTRGKNAGDVEDLVASIRAKGVLEFPIVRPFGDELFQILSGHRRVAAAKKCSIEKVQCRVEDLDDDQARAVLVLTNRNREEPDLFREAEVVTAMLHEGNGKAMTVKAVAALLGESTRWVAQRRSLLSLSEGMKARRAKAPWSTWPAAAWEAVARLAPEAQDAMMKEAETSSPGGVLFRDEPEIDVLDALVAERLRVLGKAPFDVEDARLLAGVPACAACPKTSQSVPGLFDDGEPVNVKEATCRDAVCWGKKAAAAMRAKVAAARVKAGGADGGKALDVVVVKKGYGGTPAGAGRALQPHQYTEASEGTKGAVPAVIVGDGGGVKTGFVTVQRRVSEQQAAAAPKTKPEERLAQLEREYAARIDEAVCDGFRSQLAKLSTPEPRAVLALALVAGIAWRSDVKRDRARVALATAVVAGKKVPDDAIRALWDGVRHSIDDGRMADTFGDPDVGPEAEATFVAAVLERARGTSANAPKGWLLKKAREEAAKKNTPPKELVTARAGDPKKATGKGAAAGDGDVAWTDMTAAQQAAASRDALKRMRPRGLRKKAASAAK